MHRLSLRWPRDHGLDADLGTLRTVHTSGGTTGRSARGRGPRSRPSRPVRGCRGTGANRTRGRRDPAHVSSRDRDRPGYVGTYGAVGPASPQGYHRARVRVRHAAGAGVGPSERVQPRARVPTSARRTRRRRLPPVRVGAAPVPGSPVRGDRSTLGAGNDLLSLAPHLQQGSTAEGGRSARPSRQGCTYLGARIPSHVASSMNLLEDFPLAARPANATIFTASGPVGVSEN